jgi:RNA polymerase sigma-70 factor (ECF subfamily)
VIDPTELRELEALRSGDERAFMEVVERYHSSLLRVAQIWVSSRSVAEEVVQDTWVAVLRGIDRFEGRSSLKTWIFRILANTAKTRGVREGRTIPFSSLQNPGAVPEPALSPDRFRDSEDPSWPGHWASHPAAWDELPEKRLESLETRARLEAAIAELPAAQRAVISLRDIEGWSSEEVRNALELGETNQRVLLHRARSKVRAALEEYLREDVT